MLEREQKVSKRNLLKLTAVLTGNILLSGCSWLKHTPEPTSTPERPKILERIDLGIPGLSVEVYNAKFQEITSEVSPSSKKSFIDWFTELNPGYFSKNPDESFDRSPFKPFNEVSFEAKGYPRCGPSALAFGIIRPKKYLEWIYYDGKNDRFYSDIPGVTGDDKRMLGWVDYKGDNSSLSLSCNGKILYHAEGRPIKGDRYNGAVIIADVPNSTKTLIKDSQTEQHIVSQLSDDGSKLLLHFQDSKDPKRGLYLIDLNNWRVQFHIDKLEDDWGGTFLNEDGSRLYLRSEGVLYNTLSGEKTAIPWPTFLSTRGSTASRDLNYFAGLVGMFSANREVEGQWGIMVRTPEGIFMISSPRISFVPHRVDNDGTIYTDSWDIFKFEGGTYKLVRPGPQTDTEIQKSGKPLEVNIRKVGD